MIPEIQEELLKVQNAIHHREKWTDQQLDELMMIQQTLSWVLDYRTAASPFEVMVRKMTLNNAPYPINPKIGKQEPVDPEATSIP